MSASVVFWSIPVAAFTAAFLSLARQIRVAASKRLSFEPRRNAQPETAVAGEPWPAAIEQPRSPEPPSAAPRWSASPAAEDRGFDSLARENFARLCSGFGICVISILPSTGRPRGQGQANVEILVEFESGAKLDYSVVFRLRQELFAIFGQQVDLVSRNCAELAGQRELFANARVLYAA